MQMPQKVRIIPTPAAKGFEDSHALSKGLKMAARKRCQNRLAGSGIRPGDENDSGGHRDIGTPYFQWK
jgi:hypothetical protein